MKKIYSLFVFITVALLAVGCNGIKNNNSADSRDKEYKCKTFVNKSINPKENLVRIVFHQEPADKSAPAPQQIQVGMNGNKIYVETVAEDIGYVRTVYADGFVFSVNDAEKTIVKAAAGEVNPMELMFNVDEINTEGKDITKGKEAVGGIEYEYEELPLEYGVIRFYFSNSVCKAVKTVEGDFSTVYIIEHYDNSPTEEKFQLPSDYKTDVYEVE